MLSAYVLCSISVMYLQDFYTGIRYLNLSDAKLVGYYTGGKQKYNVNIQVQESGRYLPIVHSYNSSIADSTVKMSKNNLRGLITSELDILYGGSIKSLANIGQEGYYIKPIPLKLNEDLITSANKSSSLLSQPLNRSSINYFEPINMEKLKPAKFVFYPLWPNDKVHVSIWLLKLKQKEIIRKKSSVLRTTESMLQLLLIIITISFVYNMRGRIALWVKNHGR